MTKKTRKKLFSDLSDKLYFFGLWENITSVLNNIHCRLQYQKIKTVYKILTREYKARMKTNHRRYDVRSGGVRQNELL